MLQFVWQVHHNKLTDISNGTPFNTLQPRYFTQLFVRLDNQLTIANCHFCAAPVGWW